MFWCTPFCTCQSGCAQISGLKSYQLMMDGNGCGFSSSTVIPVTGPSITCAVVELIFEGDVIADQGMFKVVFSRSDGSSAIVQCTALLTCEPQSICSRVLSDSEPETEFCIVLSFCVCEGVIGLEIVSKMSSFHMQKVDEYFQTPARLLIEQQLEAALDTLVTLEAERDSQLREKDRAIEALIEREVETCLLRESQSALRSNGNSENYSPTRRRSTEREPTPRSKDMDALNLRTKAVTRETSKTEELGYLRDKVAKLKRIGVRREQVHQSFCSKVEGTCVSSTDNKSHSESAISARVVSPSGRNKETPSNFRSINVRTSFNALVQSTRIDEKMNKEEKCHTQRLKRLEESFDRLHLEQFHNAKGTAKPVDKKIQDENSESRTSSPLRASLKKEIPIERSASARHRNASPNSLLRTSPLRMAENLVMGIKGKKPAMR